MAKAPPKDADQLAAAGYDNLAQPEAEAQGDVEAAAPEGAPESSFTWQNDRDKALLTADKFGEDGSCLYGDDSCPVFGISFPREHLAPPAAKVRAKDRENAWAKYRRIMGILSTEHEPQITQIGKAKKKAAAASA